MMPVLISGLSPLVRVAIPGGTFEMELNDVNDAPSVTDVTVSTFEISKTRITIDAYQEYLRAIGNNRWTRAVQNERTGDFTVVAQGMSRTEVQEAYLSSLAKAMLPAARIEPGGFMVFEVVDPELPEEFRKSPDQPEVRIDWWDTLAFAAAHGGDLPTGAEYERVQRGKFGKDKYGTVSGQLRAKDGGKLAQFGEDQTSPVKWYPANSWGVYDASGNTWVWTKDWYAPSSCEHEYGGRSKKDPRGPRYGDHRVLCGGSYDNVGVFLHAGHRNSSDPRERITNFGGVVVWRSQDSK